MGNLAWNYQMMERVVGCEIDADRWCFLPSTILDPQLTMFDPDKKEPVIKNTKISLAMDVISNGTFALTTKDSLWRVHNDRPNGLAAVIYLEPDAPFDTGTSFLDILKLVLLRWVKILTDVDKLMPMIVTNGKR